MVFFDLSVPYLESDGAASKENAARKEARLKVVVKAMELGYSGVAYDRVIKGVMSDRDRCTIPPFPLSSLLKVAPALSASVTFHRRLVGVPLSDPFRQYRRLTVAADTLAQVATLNSGNPVLRTYDLVAVRPLSQASFDQACSVAEVDLIAVNFSQKLPFRLKLPMVKAAIERGICFEITYSHFLSNAQSRRQMLSGAKLLVEWTRGKNIIFSSAATSADELRGPYDVANLSSLLGLSTEHAKAAFSKNCRFLLNRALRKKQFYKEAIKIEKLPPTEQLNQKLFSDWSNWDAISSGDGDLPSPEDFAKHLSDAIQIQKNPFHDLNSILNENVLQGPVSFRQGLIPPNDSVTATPEMQLYFTSNKTPGSDRPDGDVLDNGENGPDSLPTFSLHAIVQDSVSDMNKVARSLEVDLPSSSAANIAYSFLEASRCDSGAMPSSPYNCLLPTPSKPVDMVTQNSICSNEIPISRGHADSPLDFSTVVGIIDLPTCDNAVLETPQEPETFATAVVTDGFSDYHMNDKDLASQEVLDSPEIMPFEETIDSADSKKEFVLVSSSALEHECALHGYGHQAESKSPVERYDGSLCAGVGTSIVDEKEDGGQHVVNSIMEGAGFDKLSTQSSVLDLSAINMLLKENRSAVKGHGLLSTSEARLRKQKPGRGKFMQKLQREVLHMPCRGLFKPLLFRRKIHQSKGFRKRYSSCKS